MRDWTLTKLHMTIPDSKAINSVSTSTGHPDSTELNTALAEVPGGSSTTMKATPGEPTRGMNLLLFWYSRSPFLPLIGNVMVSNSFRFSLFFMSTCGARYTWKLNSAHWFQNEVKPERNGARKKPALPPAKKPWELGCSLANHRAVS